MRDTRTPDQIREHYEIQVELADRLRQGSVVERHSLDTGVYEGLFRRVPHHPQLVNREFPQGGAAKSPAEAEIGEKYLSKGSRYLEIGPGDCAMAFEIASL